MPYMPNVSINSQTEPLPSDYEESLRSYFGLGTELMISEPRRMNAWSVLEPGIWYVCVRREPNRDEVYAFSNGRIAGRIEPYKSKVDGSVAGILEGYCAGAHFEPLP